MRLDRIPLLRATVARKGHHQKRVWLARGIIKNDCGLQGHRPNDGQKLVSGCRRAGCRKTPVRGSGGARVCMGQTAPLGRVLFAPIRRFRFQHETNEEAPCGGFGQGRRLHSAGDVAAGRRPTARSRLAIRCHSPPPQKKAQNKTAYSRQYDAMQPSVVGCMAPRPGHRPEAGPPFGCRSIKERRPETPICVGSPITWSGSAYRTRIGLRDTRGPPSSPLTRPARAVRCDWMRLPKVTARLSAEFDRRSQQPGHRTRSTSCRSRVTTRRSNSAMRWSHWTILWSSITTRRSNVAGSDVKHRETAAKLCDAVAVKRTTCRSEKVSARSRSGFRACFMQSRPCKRVTSL